MVTKRKRKNSYTEEDGKAANHYNPIPEFTKNEIQDAIGRLKKRERKR